MTVPTCACGRFAAGYCAFEGCGVPVCHERYLPGVTTSSCGRLVEGRLLCPTHQQTVLAQKAQDAKRREREAEDTLHAAAREAAAALEARGVPATRLAWLRVERGRTRFRGRQTRSVSVITDHGHGWLLSPPMWADGWSTGSPGTLLTTDGKVFATAGAPGRASSDGPDLRDQLDDGTPVFCTRGAPGAAVLKQLRALATADAAPIGWDGREMALPLACWRCGEVSIGRCETPTCRRAVCGEAHCGGAVAGRLYCAECQAMGRAATRQTGAPTDADAAGAKERARSELEQRVASAAATAVEKARTSGKAAVPLVIVEPDGDKTRNTTNGPVTMPWYRLVREVGQGWHLGSSVMLRDDGMLFAGANYKHTFRMGPKGGTFWEAGPRQCGRPMRTVLTVSAVRSLTQASNEELEDLLGIVESLPALTAA